MARKTWSTFFFLLALGNLLLGLVSNNPMRVYNLIAMACCFSLGAVTRRRMI